MADGAGRDAGGSDAPRSPAPDAGGAAASGGGTDVGSAAASAGETSPSVQHPAGLLYGRGHVVVHGNLPFRELFGAGIAGLPAAEALIDLPRSAFALMDLVYLEGRPLARRITLRGASWRLTIAPRRDIGDGEVYGIAVHLVPREDRDTAV
jgi:hypothetical protein